jgi:cell division protein FtsI/penicillin-binding protein 2
MSKGFASSYRIVLLASGLFVCFGGVAARLVWLHVVDRDSLLKTITRTRQQMTHEVARRGDILDARGGLLATSSTRRVLGVDPSSLRPQDEKRWPELAALIGMPETELRRIFLTRYKEPAAAPVATATKPAAVALNFKLPAALPDPAAGADEDDESEVDATPDDKGRRPIRWVKLRDDVPEKLYEDVMKLGIKGVYGNHVARRVYPNQNLAAHIIGYVNRDQEAVAGMEAYADFYLRGQNGWRVGERDGRNRELPQFLDRRVPPVDGYSVKLSIDTIVQDIVEQELTYIATTYEPKKASIIVSDPRTGFILAMGNYPNFDPNLYNKVPKSEQHRMRNAAVADVYEPGSVFKIVAVAAALQEGTTTRCSTAVRTGWRTGVAWSTCRRRITASRTPRPFRCPRWSVTRATAALHCLPSAWVTSASIVTCAPLVSAAGWDFPSAPRSPVSSAPRRRGSRSTSRASRSAIRYRQRYYRCTRR